VPAVRAFIAVELADAVRAQIAGIQQDLRRTLEGEGPAGPRIAWTRPASLHLTLKFLGDIDEASAPALHGTLAAALRSCCPIAIPLARLGAFPRAQEPRALWLGAPIAWERGPDAARLVALVNAIEACAEPLGVPRERRPFTPHLTLARIKSGERHAGRALARRAAFDRAWPLGPLVVDALTLMKSRLDSGGAVHTPLWTIRLDTVS
jgi:2'-5' RNA ligase